MDKIPAVSFVVPVFNEEDNVNQLCSDITDVAKEEGFKYEIILINDGSSDKTWKRITEASKTYPNVTGLDLAINSGQSAALAAGIELARGEFIVTLDGDLQNDPRDVPMMLEKQKENNWDMVAGERVNRKDKLITRKLPSRIANAMIRILSGVKLRDYGCALRVFKQETAKNLELYGELHRFIPVLAVLQGASMIQVPVRHHKRSHGKSKYGLGRTFRVISDLMFMVFFKRYKDRPIHLFGTLGLITFGLGAVIDIYLFILKILGHDIWGKPLLLLGILLTIGGIQIITIGIISEILMRTYYESQNKKPYRIKRTIRSEVQN